MPLNFPTSPSINTTYTDNNGISWVYDGTKWNVTQNNLSNTFYGLKLGFVNTVSLTTQLSPLNFNSEIWDTGDFFSLPNNPTKVFFNRAGYYRLNIQLLTGTVGSGASYNASIRKNGITTFETIMQAANQAAVYDDVVEFAAGDYIEILASEDNGTGELTTDTFVEVTLLGYTAGSTIGQIFSGVKTILTGSESVTSTNTAIVWDNTDFNINASGAGDFYWTGSLANTVTFYTNAYYNIKSDIIAGAVGGDNSYYLILKKNDTTILDEINFGPNDTIHIDSTYTFSANDFIKMYIKNTGGTGTLTANSYLQVTRLGA